jgi:hypothetical protein
MLKNAGFLKALGTKDRLILLPTTLLADLYILGHNIFCPNNFDFDTELQVCSFSGWWCAAYDFKILNIMYL